MKDCGLGVAEYELRISNLKASRREIENFGFRVQNLSGKILINGLRIWTGAS